MAFWNKLNRFDKIKGTDYSDRYVSNKNAYFYINRESDINEIVVFKPFLSDLSYDLKVTTEPNSDSVTNSNPTQVITDATIQLKVALDIPAVSVSEAMANKQKVSKVLTWLRDPEKTPRKIGSTKQKSTEKYPPIIS